MNNIIKKIIKADKVLLIAWILAVISAFWVKPGSAYMDYIDFRSLGILWGLMVIIQGFKENSVFEKIGSYLMSKVHSGGQLAAVLVFICFIGSMFITNDVALITFVPFALMILRDCGREDMMIPVVVLQTVAANLGSMLTPIGNPQNLYLYGVTGMGIAEFIMTMLPYSVVSALLLAAALLLIPGRTRALSRAGRSELTVRFGSPVQIAIYALLFLIALLSVIRVVPWQVMALIVLVIVGGMDYKILLQADYILLLTFVGFFIFTGNMGKIAFVSDFLKSIVSGREFAISIVASQFISNVPATLMLSGFTENYKALLVGVNVGGLGSLIASMASLISFKAYSKAYKDKTGRYLLVFTVINIVFLAALVILSMVFSIR
ncbi:SLC13 family permease [Butyrivibrio sp. MC2013]|uniref:SLC13 family permease n=1 Tax=Butyrivibrio sp. MC2013 TaxID=1280686 RepID=UPI00041F62F5|nr:SLC13 family permease [Butyrivibrio sp. MC2013]